MMQVLGIGETLPIMRDDSDIVAILWYIYRSIGHLCMRSIAENMTYIYIYT